MYSFTVKSKVFQILTYIRQERPNEQYRNTVKDLLLPNTVSLKDEKPHTAGMDDTTIFSAHLVKSKLLKYRLKKSSIPQYHKPPCPSLKSNSTRNGRRGIFRIMWVNHFQLFIIYECLIWDVLCPVYGLLAH